MILNPTTGFLFTTVTSLHFGAYIVDSALWVALNGPTNVIWISAILAVLCRVHKVTGGIECRDASTQPINSTMFALIVLGDNALSCLGLDAIHHLTSTQLPKECALVRLWN